LSGKPLLQRAASRLAGFFGVRLYDLYYVEKNLLTEIEAVESPIELTIREATDQDLETIMDRLGPKIRQNFQNAGAIGSICFIALHQGNIAGYTWINRRYIDLVGHIAAALPAEGAYNYNSYVFPEYRGKRVFQSMIRLVYLKMKQENRKFAANLVDKDNQPSIAARERFGATFQSARFLKLPGCRPLIVGKKFIMGKTVSS
jgi:ribosomal protein S18 acetylase RimI-like enzyme